MNIGKQDLKTWPWRWRNYGCSDHN